MGSFLPASNKGDGFASCFFFFSAALDGNGRNFRWELTQEGGRINAVVYLTVTVRTIC